MPIVDAMDDMEDGHRDVAAHADESFVRADRLLVFQQQGRRHGHRQVFGVVDAGIGDSLFGIGKQQSMVLLAAIVFHRDVCVARKHIVAVVGKWRVWSMDLDPFAQVYEEAIAMKYGIGFFA